MIHGLHMHKPKSLLGITAALVALCIAAFSLHGQTSSDPGSSTQGRGRVGPSGKFVPTPAPHDPGKKQPSPVEARKNLLNALKLENLGNGKYRVGAVTLDKKARTVSFRVKVNMTRGQVEYALVTERGKTHESVFTTAARPTDIHLACVLLGMKQAGGKDWPAEHAAIPTHRGVDVLVTWPTNGPPKRLPLSACIKKKNTDGYGGRDKPLEDGVWFYSGSRFYGGVFAAEAEGSVISIIGDGSALLNGLRKGNGNDLLHSADGGELPPKGRTVTMVLTLPKPPAPDAQHGENAPEKAG